MRLETLFFLSAGFVHATIKLDGTLAVAPATESDPSPVGDPGTYYQLVTLSAHIH